jgi:hypothetical protein
MANGYEPGDYFRQFLNQLPQMYYAKKSADLQRDRFDYYKEKDKEAAKQKALDKQYRRNVQAWGAIQSHARSLPYGEQSKFMRNQLDTLSEDFIKNESLTQWVDSFESQEKDYQGQQMLADNLYFEDSPDKIHKALQLGLIKDPNERRRLKKVAVELEQEYGKQPAFDINKLDYDEQRIYKANEKLLSDSEEEMGLAQQGIHGKAPDPDVIAAARKKVEHYRAIIQPFVQKAAPITIPEFKYSPESIKEIASRPELLESFFADPSNDLDDYIQSQLPPAPEPEPKPVPEPEPIVAEGSIWESYEKETTVAAPGGFKVVKQKDYRLKSGAPEKYKSNLVHRQEESKLKSQIEDYEKRISNVDNNLAGIERVKEQKIIKAGMGPAARTRVAGSQRQAEAARQEQLGLKRKLEKELADIRKQYELIRRPFPEVIQDVQ